MDICLRVLKESNQISFDSYSVRNSVLIISHITFRDCRVHIFSDNLSRNIYIFFYLFLFYFIITLGIHLQYSYTVLTYNKTTKFTYVTALLTCLLLTYIKIPKTSLQQTKGLLKTINK